MVFLIYNFWGIILMKSELQKTKFFICITYPVTCQTSSMNKVDNKLSNHILVAVFVVVSLISRTWNNCILEHMGYFWNIDW